MKKGVISLNLFIILYMILSFLRLATNFMYLFLLLFHTSWVNIHIGFAIIGIILNIFMITYLSQLREHVEPYRKKISILLLLDVAFFIVGTLVYFDYLKEINLYANAIFGHPVFIVLNVIFLIYLYKIKK